MNVSGDSKHHVFQRVVDEPKTKIVDDYLKLIPTFGKDFASTLVSNSNVRSNTMDSLIENTKYFDALKPIFGKDESHNLIIDSNSQTLQKIVSRLQHYPKLKEYFGEQQAKEIIQSNLLNEKDISSLLSSPDKRTIYTTAQAYIKANNINIPASLVKYVLTNTKDILQLVQKLPCLEFYQKLLIQNPEGRKIFDAYDAERLVKSQSTQDLARICSNMQEFTTIDDGTGWYHFGVTINDIINYDAAYLRSKLNSQYVPKTGER